MSNGSVYSELEIAELSFGEALEEYLEIRGKGPDESSGYTDKWYYQSMGMLLKRMDQLVHGKE